MYGHENTFWGYWPMVLFWAALIVVAVIIIAAFVNRKSWFGREASPREILDRRYAAGEISREEYEKIKQDLKSGDTAKS